MKDSVKRDWDNATFGEFKSALKELKENPHNHGYSNIDVEKILEFEKENLKYDTFSPEFLAFTAKINESIKVIAEGMNKFHQAISDNLKNYVSRGWYISPTVIGEISLRDVYPLTSKANAETFEAYIFSKVDSKIGKLLDDISLAYPDRKKIFEEMKGLYKNKYYHSFITLCYSQADGICNDKWNQGFFNTDYKNNYALKLPYKFNFESSSVADAIGKQLNEPKNEFTADYSKSEIQVKRNSYNRHLVIHGQSTSYGTKENAIRALLLLEFVKWLANQEKNQKLA